MQDGSAPHLVPSTLAASPVVRCMHCGVVWGPITGMTMEETKLRGLVAVLAECRGQITLAGRTLSMSRHAVVRWCRRFDVPYAQRKSE